MKTTVGGFFGKLCATLVFCGLCAALPVLADQYWVIGSYRDAGAARDEAERLAALLDEPVTWKRFDRGADAPPVYRLLMPYPDGGERDQSRARLRDAGIAAPWWLVVDMPTPSPAMPARERASTDAVEAVHIQVGSFDSLQASIEAEERLGRAFTGIRTESGLANGRLRYRILLGPVAPRDVDDVFARLEGLGFDVAREIEVDTVDSSFVDFVDIRDRRRTRREPQDEAVDEEKQADYNPATLREERPKFSVKP